MRLIVIADQARSASQKVAQGFAQSNDEGTDHDKGRDPIFDRKCALALVRVRLIHPAQMTSKNIVGKPFDRRDCEIGDWCSTQSRKGEGPEAEHPSYQRLRLAATTR